MSTFHQQAAEFKPTLQVVIESKLDEFRMLGFDTVSEDELWECLEKTIWRKKEEEPKLFQLVEDILSLTVNDYMNYVRIEAFKSPTWQFGESV
ncbi:MULTISPECIES: post-transcriptional regulator [unclassified Bacillus (in: firmicutes)]|uniref:post-transcriptional regulator n=1 Tax=unclassified Bacillus (in: firmicutes) TaxID=185979 RepID=UPI000BF0E48C|nr:MULTISPECIES: post-transcriptional regulator [unclassified Bacillus (in: firmicutes)]PEJ51785.1 histidine kinase [Bacillus sp. AFS002410]PEK98659.1 histidine kinase [Bacillus sp. AFS017336]